MKNKIFTLLLCLCFTGLLKAQLNPGDIMCIGFNADGKDDVAYVTLVPIPASTTLYVTDNEWTGTAFNTGEGTLSWASGAAAIPAGTVLLFSNLSDTMGLRSANIGTLTPATATGVANFGVSNESVFLFEGTSGTAPTKLLNVAMNGLVPASAGTLMGSGLVENFSAQLFLAGVDIAGYRGVRTGLDKASYITAINDFATNWGSQDSAGDQHLDGRFPDVPFNSAIFTISTSDLTPPAALSGTLSNATTLVVKLTEKVTKTSAETLANYSITPSITLTSAVYDSVRLEVTLTGNSFVSGRAYTLTVNNLRDNSNNLQTVASVFRNIIFNNYTGTGLMFSEFMYQVSTTADSVEFLEIYNQTSAPIAIGGLSFTAGITGSLPEFSIPARTAVCVAADTGAFRRFYGVSAVAQWATGQFLSNAGELVSLSNTAGGLLDSVRYDDVAPWPTAAAGLGASLELISASLDNALSTSWRASVTNTGKVFGVNMIFASPNSFSTTRVDEITEKDNFTIAPTLVTGETLYFNREVSGSVLDVNGQEVLKFVNKSALEVGALKSGIHFVRSTGGGVRKFVVQH
jgi:hypothetical protein